MNEIQQYRPAFFDGFENEVAQFSSVNDLKKIPFVLHFSEIDGFRGFAISDKFLVAIYKDGKEWVVGTIQNPGDVDLPVMT